MVFYSKALAASRDAIKALKAAYDAVEILQREIKETPGVPTEMADSVKKVFDFEYEAADQLWWLLDDLAGCMMPNKENDPRTIDDIMDGYYQELSKALTMVFAQIVMARDKITRSHENAIKHQVNRNNIMNFKKLLSAQSTMFATLKDCAGILESNINGWPELKAGIENENQQPLFRI